MIHPLLYWLNLVVDMADLRMKTMKKLHYVGKTSRNFQIYLKDLTTCIANLLQKEDDKKKVLCLLLRGHLILKEKVLLRFLLASLK